MKLYRDKRVFDFIENINTILLLHYGNPKKNNIIPSPLEVLIATILSQNTNDQNSFKAFSALKARFNDFREINSISIDELKILIKTAGLTNQKAEAIKSVVKAVCIGDLVLDRDYIKLQDDETIMTSLTKFKGVGIKTAACVLLFSLERNICPVDTHVHRVLNKLGVVKANDRAITFQLINGNIPVAAAHSFHTNLIRLGRDFCLPAKLHCFSCPLFKLCLFDYKMLNQSKVDTSRSFMLLDNLK